MYGPRESTRWRHVKGCSTDIGKKCRPLVFEITCTWKGQVRSNRKGLQFIKFFHTRNLYLSAKATASRALLVDTFLRLSNPLAWKQFCVPVRESSSESSTPLLKCKGTVRAYLWGICIHFRKKRRPTLDFLSSGASSVGPAKCNPSLSCRFTALRLTGKGREEVKSTGSLQSLCRVSGLEEETSPMPLRTSPIESLLTKLFLTEYTNSSLNQPFM